MLRTAIILFIIFSGKKDFKIKRRKFFHQSVNIALIVLSKDLSTFSLIFFKKEMSSGRLVIPA